MPLQKILFKAGVNRENTRYTTEGGWYDSDKVRFRQGTPEKIGGWAQISEYTYDGVCRSLWSWSTLRSVLLTGVGTNEKFYIEEGGFYNDVTPIRSYTTLSNPFTATTGSTTITVSYTGHGANEGDYVSFLGAKSLSQQSFTRSSSTDFVLTSALADNTPVIVYTSSGGSLPSGLVEGVVYYIKVVSGTTVNLTNVPNGVPITTLSAGSGTFYLYVNTGITETVLNNTFKVTVIDQNTFTIQSPVAATAYDTGNGGTTVNTTFGIHIGFEIAQALTGWGAGPWGKGAWGIGEPGTANLRVWYQDNFGEDLIFGYSGGPLYYWTAAIGPSFLTLTPTINSTNISAIDTATDYITVVSATGLEEGMPVKFTTTGTFPTASPVLIANTVYYIKNLSGSTAQIATSVGGTVLNFSTTGSGVLTMYEPTLFSVSGTSIAENTEIILNTTGTLPVGLGTVTNGVNGTPYYAVDSTGTTFYLSTTPQGTKAVATALGTGNLYAAPNGVSLTSLANASDVPTAANFMLVSDISRFVIAFGCTPIGSTDISPMFVRWSDQESAINWTPSVTNQAGGQLLSSGSYLVAAIQTRQEIVVFSDSAIYSMQYLGPPYVWGFQLMGDNISIISPNSAAYASGVVYWMGNDKFYKYDGRLQTLRCDLRQYIFSDINMLQADQFLSGTNEGFNEVWWFYCSASSDVIDKYVVYNYAEDIWYYGTMSRTAWLDSGINQNPIGATYENNIVEHEVGVDDNTTTTPAPIEAFISSSEFDIGDGHNFGFVWRLIPDITFRGSTAENPNVTMTLVPLENSGSGYNNPTSVGGENNAAVTRTAVVPIEQYTGQVYIRVRGRQMAFRIDSTDLGVAWQLGAPRIDIKPDGRR